MRRSRADIDLLPLSDVSSHSSSATCSLDRSALLILKHMKDVDAAAAICLRGLGQKEELKNGQGGVNTSTGFFMFMSAKPLSVCGESPNTAQSA